MKLTILMLSALFSLSALAGISLDIDFKNNKNGQKVELKEKLVLNLDETKTFAVPNSNRIVEIKITENIPKAMTNAPKSSDQLLIDLRVVEVTGKERKIISSPKIITLMGKEAIMETFEDEASKKSIMSLKIKPTRI